MRNQIIHRYEKSFESPVFLEALEICNSEAHKFMEAIDEDTTLIILSDHGFTKNNSNKMEENVSVIFGFDKRGFIKN